jgi:hypothetical protein
MHLHNMGRGDGVAKLVAHLLATAALCVRIQTSLKNAKMGDISKRVASTHQPAKKLYKKNLHNFAVSGSAFNSFRDRNLTFLKDKSQQIFIFFFLNNLSPQNFNLLPYIPVQHLHFSSKFLQAFWADFSKFYRLNFDVESDVRTEWFLYHGILQEYQCVFVAVGQVILYEYPTCYQSFTYEFHSTFSILFCVAYVGTVLVPVVAVPDMHNYVRTASAFKYHTDRTRLILKN